MFYKEAFDTASKVGLVTPVTIEGVKEPQYEHWMGKLPEFVNHLKVWGVVGMVTYAKDTSAQFEDRGKQCMFMGNESGHSGDCCRMWYPTTNNIQVT